VDGCTVSGMNAVAPGFVALPELPGPAVPVDAEPVDPEPVDPAEPTAPEPPPTFTIAPVGASVVAALLGAVLWVSGQPLARWCALVVWSLYVFGACSRWLQVKFWDRWELGPALALLADWPSTTAFGSRNRNPHGGYFVRGDAPRLLIAAILAASDGAGTMPSDPRIRSTALKIPLGPETPLKGASV